MLAPAFDVVHLEAVALQVGDRRADVIELAAGKDVAVERAELGAVLAAERAVVAFGGRVMA